MTKIALLDRHPADTSPQFVEYVDRRRLWELFPGRHNLENAADATLAELWLVRVEEVEHPFCEAWEKCDEGPAVQTEGVWQQSWVVSNIYTLAEAKQFLADRAVQVWWEKVYYRTPGTQEVIDAAGDAVAVIQARNARLKPILLQVRSAIQNATTFAELYTVYQQIEDAA